MIPRGRGARTAAMAAALVLVAGAAVWLRVHIAADQARGLYPPPERVLVVAKGAQADYMGFRWRLVSVRRERPLVPSAGMEQVTFTLQITPLNGEVAAKWAQTPSLGLAYEFRDRAGRAWVAGWPQDRERPLTPAGPAQRRLVADVPAAAAGTVELFVKKPVWSSAETQAQARQGRVPRHRLVLRFAR